MRRCRQPHKRNHTAHTTVLNNMQAAQRKFLWCERMGKCLQRTGQSDQRWSRDALRNETVNLIRGEVHWEGKKKGKK